MLTDFLPIIVQKHHNDPIFIAGPCSAESPEQMLQTAIKLQTIGIRVFRAGVWKPRTRPGGFEGHGKEALKWLNLVKQETGMLTATEIGSASHAAAAIESGVDILWIGTRTTASPFAVQEIAESLRGCDIPVMVKNPVCADIDLWLGAIERLYGCGIKQLAAIHRGFKLPGKTIYRNTPLWEIADKLRSFLPGLPVICDPSHMGGSRDKICVLSEEALKRGYDGLMIESHYNPDEALTDCFQQIVPQAVRHIFRMWKQKYFYEPRKCLN